MAPLTAAFVVMPNVPSALSKGSASAPNNQRLDILKMSGEDSFDTRNNGQGGLSTDSPGIDAAWRYIKKPLLRIGGKGVSESHGRSLCELLNAHSAVKVKVNTKKLGSLEDAFAVIKELAEKPGKIKGIELIHIRNSDNIIMFGKEGTLDMIRAGEFPPSPSEEESE